MLFSSLSSSPGRLCLCLLRLWDISWHFEVCLVYDSKEINVLFLPTLFPILWEMDLPRLSLILYCVLGMLFRLAAQHKDMKDDAIMTYSLRISDLNEGGYLSVSLSFDRSQQY
jgi:hypothetical protein